MLCGYEDQATPTIIVIASRVAEVKGFAFFIVWRVVLEGLILDDSLFVDGYMFSYADAIRCEDICQSPPLVVVVVNVTIVAVDVDFVILGHLLFLVP